MQLEFSPLRGFCQCGCGRKTALASKTRRGYRKGEPMRFITGHAFRVNKRQSDFPVINGKKVCSKCREVKPAKEFGERRDGVRPRLHSMCRPCRQVTMKWRMQRYKWGFSQEDWECRFDAQGRVCALCGTDTSDGVGWAVDHDHACCPGLKSCGKCVRGILCSSCNMGLGLFRDSPERLQLAIRYLEVARKE